MNDLREDFVRRIKEGYAQRREEDIAIYKSQNKNEQLTYQKMEELVDEYSQGLNSDIFNKVLDKGEGR